MLHNMRKFLFDVQFKSPKWRFSRKLFIKPNLLWSYFFFWSNVIYAKSLKWSLLPFPNLRTTPPNLDIKNSKSSHPHPVTLLFPSIFVPTNLQQTPQAEVFLDSVNVRAILYLLQKKRDPTEFIYIRTANALKIKFLV